MATTTYLAIFRNTFLESLYVYARMHVENSSHKIVGMWGALWVGDALMGC